MTKIIILIVALSNIGLANAAGVAVSGRLIVIGRPVVSAPKPTTIRPSIATPKATTPAYNNSWLPAWLIMQNSGADDKKCEESECKKGIKK